MTLSFPPPTPLMLHTDHRHKRLIFLKMIRIYSTPDEPVNAPPFPSKVFCLPTLYVNQFVKTQHYGA